MKNWWSLLLWWGGVLFGAAMTWAHMSIELEKCREVYAVSLEQAVEYLESLRNKR